MLFDLLLLRLQYEHLGGMLEEGDGRGDWWGGGGGGGGVIREWEGGGGRYESGKGRGEIREWEG